MSWIKKVINAYSESESPEIFFYWASLSAISAVVKKNVYLDRQNHILYPNTYIFLVAKSGMRKSVPIDFAKDSVQETKSHRIITGRGTIQAILKDLGKAHTLENGGMIKDAQAYIVSGELAALLVEDNNALTILTDLHDTWNHRRGWTNSIKGTGVDHLKNLCISLLGATNEEHFSDAVPSNAIGGGFIARTFIVYCDKPAILNSLTKPMKAAPSAANLSGFLKDVGKLSGKFEWTDDAITEFDDWYYAFMKDIVNDPTGTDRRLDSQILKAAMLIAIGSNMELILRKDYIQEAIAVAMSCRQGMRQVTLGLGGKNGLAMQTRTMMRTLLVRPDHTVERSKFLQQHWGDIDHFDLDRIVETLMAAGVIEEIKLGKKPAYKMKPEIVDQYKDIAKGYI